MGVTVKYVAIGDSFTEGVGDELPDGGARGWADLTAQGWADASGEPVAYANLAIRGRLAWPIVDEQLEAALALKPTHLSFNGGGNDMLRPGANEEFVVDAFSHVLRRCDQEGVQLIVLTGANPTQHLPAGKAIGRKGDAMIAALMRRIADRNDIIRAFNWHDPELKRKPYWAADRLHMNAYGHHRVAARVLSSLGQEAPIQWWGPPSVYTPGPGGLRYYGAFVGPWIGRRLRGTSSGDNRVAKYPDWVMVEPRG